MDLGVMNAYLPRFWDALLLTLRIGWQGVALALLLGIACAAAVHWKIPVLRQIVGGYIELFRNTPLLVQLFFLYFALPKIGISISAEACGKLGLGLLGGLWVALRISLISVAISIVLGVGMGMHPEILLLDEITAALDPEMVREVLDVVLSLAKAGSTMVIVTHEMNFARAIADRILFIENGAVVEQSDDPKAFFASPNTDRAKAFLKSFDYE